MDCEQSNSLTSVKVNSLFMVFKNITFNFPPDLVQDAEKKGQTSR